MKKYMVFNSFYSTTPEIKEVEVEDETYKTVTIKGCRKNKEADGRCYYDSWDIAKAKLAANADAIITRLTKSLDKAKREKEEVDALIKPEGVK